MIGDRVSERGNVAPQSRRDLHLQPGTSGDPRSGGWTRLNTNELPVPPSRRVIDAVHRASSTLNRYPDPNGEPLRQLLADLHRVSPESVIVGAGADGILELCFRAFCNPGSVVSVLDPTYPHIYNLAEIFGASLRLSTSAHSLISSSQTGCALTILVNPNSPTGEWIPVSRIAELAGADGLVVIDEAYADFAPESSIVLLPSMPRAVVVRTFSKSHGLAGARVGYAIGHPDVIRALASVRDPYPVGTSAIAAATGALEDSEYYARARANVMANRDSLSDALRGIGWTVPTSHGNFVFAIPPDGRVAEHARRLEEHHILVRVFARAANGIRISVGTAEEHAELIRVLSSPNS